MQLCYENGYKEIKKIVEEKAKYQKVMVLTDDNISNLQIQEIYNLIKGICVYNQCKINKLDKNEIFNGYKLIIYYCSADSYMQCNLNKSEFVNVFLPIKNEFLPFFLNNESAFENENDFLILGETKIDLLMLSSLISNKFYETFKSITDEKVLAKNIDFILRDITTNNMFETVMDYKENTVFLDVDILKKEKLSYKYIIILNLILIDAFLKLLTNIKSNRLMIVDVYKYNKNEVDIIDKMYKLYNNNSFKNLVLLNYNCLLNFCLRTKQKIKQLISFFQVEFDKVEGIINKVKNYSKNCNNIFGYLYLYNIFE